MKEIELSAHLDWLYANYQKCPYDYPFDINSTPDRFGYFEVIISKEGRVFDAPNGHQRGALLMLARDLDVSIDEVNRRASTSGMDYLDWIVSNAQVLLVWHKFYIGEPNEQQLATIKILKEKGHMLSSAYHRKQYYID